MRHTGMKGGRAVCVGVAALLTTALAGCANGVSEAALSAQRSLIGLPKTELLACAGVPARQATADGLEFFTYSVGRIVSYPSPPFGYGRWGYGYGWPGYYGDDVRSYRCEATFTLRGGKVERLVYNGGEGGAGECYDIVQTCLAQTAKAPATNAPATPAGPQ